MKHIKLFENKGDVFYIVICQHLNDSSSNWQVLFDDEESAENFYIDTVNDFLRETFYLKSSRITETYFILTFDDAVEWMTENEYDVKLHCDRVENKGTYELSKEVRLARDTKKYNL